MIDPWLRGPTYMDQAWQAWVYPGGLAALLPVHHILFTHFHPDHFHPESFPLLNKDADMLVPTTAESHLLDKAREGGFAKAREIHGGHSERLNEIEVYSLRIHDHWEFLDETSYLIVENGMAALFLADLWYVPRPLLARWANEYRLAFASLPWGGSVENLLVLPKSYELHSIDEYYRYGRDEGTLARRNALMEHGEISAVASIVGADYMIPGSFGFGWIVPEDEFVRPLPINYWLDQEAFIATMPDPWVKSKLHPMYPGDCYDTDNGEMRRQRAFRPNHRVTPEMRARSSARLDSSIRLDPERIRTRFLTKIDEALGRLKRGSVFYQDRLPHLLSAERQFEIHVVNAERQMFLFEQKRDRFSLRTINRPTGVPEIVYMPPSILNSLVDDWGPKWTDANFSGLVKVSAAGWAPYKSMSSFFG
jgi:hypothetical protein